MLTSFYFSGGRLEVEEYTSISMECMFERGDMKVYREHLQVYNGEILTWPFESQEECY